MDNYDQIVGGGNHGGVIKRAKSVDIADESKNEKTPLDTVDDVNKTMAVESILKPKQGKQSPAVEVTIGDKGELIKQTQEKQKEGQQDQEKQETKEENDFEGEPKEVDIEEMYAEYQKSLEPVGDVPNIEMATETPLQPKHTGPEISNPAVKTTTSTEDDN